MTKPDLQHILPFVEMPSRYLGTEVNSVEKQGAALKFCLGFPDIYEIGTSHFGIQILYSILNSRDEIACERVFAPGMDMADRLRSQGELLFSMESRKPLKDFDILGFSFLYELNYTNVLLMLDLAGIPFYAKDRDRDMPLVIAGGPCVFNPEPMADFFDVMVAGDGEKAVIEISNVWLEWKKQGESRDKTTLLKELSKIDGVYVPSFFRAEYDAQGFQRLVPEYPEYSKVKRAVLADLDDALFPDTPILPFGKPVHDRLRLEVARGCTRGCRYCQAGMIYRPVRERTPARLMEIADASIRSTGYSEISLLSLSTGDYGCINSLMTQLMSSYEDERVAISLPSLRAGTLTPELMSLIKKVRKTGFTIAPESGSQQLRDAINKNITDEEVLGTVSSAFAMGWKLVKLYFMIGLPFETEDDRASIIRLVKKIKQMKESKAKNINVSVTTFIPKCNTPFQWNGQITTDESRRIINSIHDETRRISGVNLKWQNPETSLLEGLWARGDRRLSKLLVNAYEKGCMYDGWSDKFKFDSWMDAIEETGIDLDFHVHRDRPIDEPMPWDHIDSGVEIEFLHQELQNAKDCILTPDCRDGKCSQCGVCDFKEIRPIVFSDKDFPADGPSGDVPSGDVPAGDDRRAKSKTKAPHMENSENRYMVKYSKTGNARFFGHIEFVHIIHRAAVRAQLPLNHTGGFHPMPKLSFGNPLPLGMESLDEYFVVSLSSPVKPALIEGRLDAELPEGIEILSCGIAPPKKYFRKNKLIRYRVRLFDGLFDEKLLRYYNEAEKVLIEKRKKTIDLKEFVKDASLHTGEVLEISIFDFQGKTLRPLDFLKEVFHLDDETIKKAEIIKICSENL